MMHTNGQAPIVIGSTGRGWVSRSSEFGAVRRRLSGRARAPEEDGGMFEVAWSGQGREIAQPGWPGVIWNCVERGPGPRGGVGGPSRVTCFRGVPGADPRGWA